MWNFFTTKKWLLWAWVGSAFILSTIWLQVQIDVRINEFFGSFYNLIQQALGEPGSITAAEYWGQLVLFLKLAGLAVVLGLLASFVTSHFLFRWRTAMVEKYHALYDKARHIEGASQRVQEDTIKFTRIMEGLGTSLIESVMVLVEFFPILMGLSAGLSIFIFGDWEYGLVTGALLWSVGGTLFLVGAGYVLRLVGIEYDLQKKEAAYRKILVKAEDDGSIRPKNIDDLFADVRKIHFRSYLQYLWFNVCRLAYLQANVLSAYVLIGPAIIAGAISLGVMQQIVRAFGRVEGSMQYILKAWPTIIELVSVYKRLREFEKEIQND
ncbi:MAG: putative transporter [Candidatus Thiodiazotropha taylori]|uniref:Transporter n=1 Tax=Candidatus Thiodiazotropha taylori TaxID=2792791 RepID=A0A9E4N1I7_9GAMM|nr:putative transporter [Candidatus Thiodiazotropha taylori]MCW4254946.1 putative transporter [Candidatus Thiodiazotropha taylori]